MFDRVGVGNKAGLKDGRGTGLGGHHGGDQSAGAGLRRDHLFALLAQCVLQRARQRDVVLTNDVIANQSLQCFAALVCLR